MVSSHELAQSLIHLLEIEDSKEKTLEAFIAFLEENNLLVQLPHIIQRLENYSREQKKHNTLVIESPFSLSQETRTLIQKQSNAEDAEDVSVIENKNLLGGFRATYQGRVVDASLRTNLQALKKKLIKS